MSQALAVRPLILEQESDIAAVQSAFSALRKEKNAAVREALNDRAIDGNNASIEVIFSPLVTVHHSRAFG